MANILEIENLCIDFASANGPRRVVSNVSFNVKRGETLGIVGESGSGKSVTALSVMRLLSPDAATYPQGEIRFSPNENRETINFLALNHEAMRTYRGASVSMVFQEPMTSLNPVFKCGHQVTEAIQLHQKISFSEARDQTLALFERVRLPEPSRIFEAYPHQISGGQKQRVMIAMAMSCNPQLLIADEPTTALDVTVQKTIIELMRDLKTGNGLSMIFISHDLGVISEICDRVVVMYEGKIVEEGTTNQILNKPVHPYTKGLIACRPSLQHRLHRLPTIPDLLENTGFRARVVSKAETENRLQAIQKTPPLLEVRDVVMRYPKRKDWLGRVQEWNEAVKKVSFDVYAGETFGLAGESGCGKTTLGRSIVKLNPVHHGAIYYKGVNLADLKERAFRPYRREIQMIFQDPYASLNPRMSIGEAIVEPMQTHKILANNQSRNDKAVDLLETVGLNADHFKRYPHEFSGGQRQRICIARALALEPKFIICDEIVSALDVSVQATVLNLLLELREKFSLTYLFISHDLSVIKQMCDRLLIMNQGKIEALGTPDEIFEHPSPGYVQNLIGSIPGSFQQE